MRLDLETASLYSQSYQPFLIRSDTLTFQIMHIWKWRLVGSYSRLVQDSEGRYNLLAGALGLFQCNANLSDKDSFLGSESEAWKTGPASFTASGQQLENAVFCLVLCTAESTRILVSLHSFVLEVSYRVSPPFPNLFLIHKLKVNNATFLSSPTGNAGV